MVSTLAAAAVLNVEHGADSYAPAITRVSVYRANSNEQAAPSIRLVCGGPFR
jgi:hypothetical protein